MKDMLSPRTVLECNKLRLEALRNQEGFPDENRTDPEQLEPYIAKIEDCIRRAEAMLPDTFNFENLADCESFQILMNYAQLLVFSAFQNEPNNKFPEVSSNLKVMKSSYVERADKSHAKTNKIKAKIKIEWDAWQDGKLHFANTNKFAEYVMDKYGFPADASSIRKYDNKWREERKQKL